MLTDTRLAAHKKCTLTPYTEKLPHLPHAVTSNPADCPTIALVKTNDQRLLWKHEAHFTKDLRQKLVRAKGSGFL